MRQLRSTLFVMLATVPLSVLASHSVSTIVTPNLCNGDGMASATAVVNGGSGSFSYEWSNSESTGTISNLTPGTYLVVVTDLVNGDQVPAFAVVVDPPALSATINSGDSICFDSCDGNADVTASGGTPGYTYLWNNNETGTFVSGLCGSISVTVTDANGCSYAAADEIEQPPTPIVTHTLRETHAAQSCDGAIELNVSSGTPPFSAVSWEYESVPVGTLPDNCVSTPSCISLLDNACTGAYLARFTDANACSIMHEVTVTALPIQVFGNGFES